MALLTLEQRERIAKHNFIKIAEDGVVEIYCDNHILSSVRTCEAYFAESILSSVTTRHRSWSLEFGMWLHSCLEFYYEFHLKGKPLNVTEWCSYASVLWESMDMEYHSREGNKNCKTLGGKMGALGLLGQYYVIHNDTERLRTVAIEVGFGKHKEVPIIAIASDVYPFRAYLTGRIDRIIDNGSSISPLDHKSAGSFRGGEITSFKPHEGMQGYVYAVQQIMSANFPHLVEQGKICNSIVINHISVAPTTNPADRFKRSTIYYTPAEMEAYVKRQQRTFRRIYDIVVNGEAPDWNTQVCGNIYFHECPFRGLHEQDPSIRDVIMNQKYTTRPQWNPYDPDANLTKGELEAEKKAREQSGLVEIK